MDAAALIASLLVGTALLVSGGSKIASGSAWYEDARQLGAPEPTIPVLPWVELVLGAALITQLAPRAMALAALLLMLAFTALIVRRLAAGEHPPCACFGAWSAAPLGWWHVVRNAVLVVLCAVAVSG